MQIINILLSYERYKLKTIFEIKYYYFIILFKTEVYILQLHLYT